MSELKENLKRQIVDQLNLKDIQPEDIGDDTPLFVEGLGLDSIDALEMIVLLQQQYGIKMVSSEEGPKVFRSVNSMAEFIESNKASQ